MPLKKYLSELNCRAKVYCTEPDEISSLDEVQNNYEQEPEVLHVVVPNNNNLGPQVKNRASSIKFKTSNASDRELVGPYFVRPVTQNRPRSILKKTTQHSIAVTSILATFIIFLSLFSFIPVSNATISTIFSDIDSLLPAENVLLSNFGFNDGIQSAINGYGCWCVFNFFTGQEYYKPKSQPKDEIDAQCKILHNGYGCIQMDSENNDCFGWTTGYNDLDLAEITSFVQNYDDSSRSEMEALLRAACETENPGDTCQSRACTVENNFKIRIVQLFLSLGVDNAIDQTYSHDTLGGSFDPFAQCTVSRLSPGDQECCGQYPVRFSYKPQNGARACCQSSGKTYDPSRLQCCEDGRVRKDCSISSKVETPVTTGVAPTSSILDQDSSDSATTDPNATTNPNVTTDPNAETNPTEETVTSAQLQIQSAGHLVISIDQSSEQTEQQYANQIDMLTEYLSRLAIGPEQTTISLVGMSNEASLLLERSDDLSTILSVVESTEQSGFLSDPSFAYAMAEELMISEVQRKRRSPRLGFFDSISPLSGMSLLPWSSGNLEESQLNQEIDTRNGGASVDDQPALFIAFSQATLSEDDINSAKSFAQNIETQGNYVATVDYSNDANQDLSDISSLPQLSLNVDLKNSDESLISQHVDRLVDIWTAIINQQDLSSLSLEYLSSSDSESENSGLPKSHMVFVVDRSSENTYDQYQYSIDFIEDILSNITISSTETVVSIIGISKESNVYIAGSSDRTEVDDKIWEIRYDQSTVPDRDIAGAMALANNLIATIEIDDQADSDVLLTDLTKQSSFTSSNNNSTTQREPTVIAIRTEVNEDGEIVRTTEILDNNGNNAMVILITGGDSSTSDWIIDSESGDLVNIFDIMNESGMPITVVNYNPDNTNSTHLQGIGAGGEDNYFEVDFGDEGSTDDAINGILDQAAAAGAGVGEDQSSADDDASDAAVTTDSAIVASTVSVTTNPVITESTTDETLHYVHFDITSRWSYWKHPMRIVSYVSGNDFPASTGIQITINNNSPPSYLSSTEVQKIKTLPKITTGNHQCIRNWLQQMRGAYFKYPLSQMMDADAFDLCLPCYLDCIGKAKPFSEINVWQDFWDIVFQEPEGETDCTAACDSTNTAPISQWVRTNAGGDNSPQNYWCKDYWQIWGLYMSENTGSFAQPSVLKPKETMKISEFDIKKCNTEEMIDTMTAEQIKTISMSPYFSNWFNLSCLLDTFRKYFDFRNRDINEKACKPCYEECLKNKMVYAVDNFQEFQDILFGDEEDQLCNVDSLGNTCPGTCLNYQAMWNTYLIRQPLPNEDPNTSVARFFTAECLKQELGGIYEVYGLVSEAIDSNSDFNIQQFLQSPVDSQKNSCFRYIFDKKSSDLELLVSNDYDSYDVWSQCESCYRNCIGNMAEDVNDITSYDELMQWFEHGPDQFDEITGQYLSKCTSACDLDEKHTCFNWETLASNIFKDPETNEFTHETKFCLTMEISDAAKEDIFREVKFQSEYDKIFYEDPDHLIALYHNNGEQKIDRCLENENCGDLASSCVDLGGDRFIDDPIRAIPNLKCTCSSGSNQEGNLCVEGQDDDVQ